MISHLFTDVDSTFVHWGETDANADIGLIGTIKESTVVGRNKLIESGVQVVFCTGRSLPETTRCFNEIALREDRTADINGLTTLPGIYNDGMTVIGRCGSVIHQPSLSEDEIRVSLTIIDDFFNHCHTEQKYNRAPVVCLTHPDSKTILNHPDCPLVTQFMTDRKLGCRALVNQIIQYSSSMALDHGETLSSRIGDTKLPINQDTSCHFIDFLSHVHEIDQCPILGLLVIVPEIIEECDITYLNSLIPETYQETLEVTFKFDVGFGIARKGANKAGAIEAYMRLEQERCSTELRYSVIGDGVNDIPMLLQVKHHHPQSFAFVMGQARQIVRDTGTHVVNPSGDDGWMEAATMIMEHNLTITT